jgi:hypothetical protein
MNATNSSMKVGPLAKQAGVKINTIRDHERRGRNYWPLILGVVASGAILIGKFVLDATPVTVGGVGLLIAAYLWSFWLRRPSKASACQSYGAPATTAAAEKSIAPETMINSDIPIACALSHGQFAERKELVQHLSQEATERHELPDGVGLRFKPVSGVTELAKLVDLERACCPFLTFRIDAPAGGPVWLELTGTAAAQEIICELSLLGSDCAAGRRIHDLRNDAARSRFAGAFEHVYWNWMLAEKFSRAFDPEDRRRLFD